MMAQPRRPTAEESVVTVVRGVEGTLIWCGDPHSLAARARPVNWSGPAKFAHATAIGAHGQRPIAADEVEQHVLGPELRCVELKQLLRRDAELLTVLRSTALR